MNLDLLQKNEAPPVDSQSLDRFQERFETLMENVASIVVTSPQNIKLALLGLFARGHVLLEDLPGVGKTLIAKTIASSIDGEFCRVQFTPDLLPSDITGTSVYDAKNQTFEFVPGPIFANVVVADELNRAGPRTQSALLEAMAEGQVSADGTSRPLPKPFFIVATQNQIERHGTFPLPNSQLDRFMISMSLGLPTTEQEMEILNRSEHGMPEVRAKLTPADVVEMQNIALSVKATSSVKQYIVNLAAASRQRNDMSVGVSPRGSATLLSACQTWATFDGRAFVVPEDVQELAPYIWGHRIVVGREEGAISGREAVGRLLESIPVPL